MRRIWSTGLILALLVGLFMAACSPPQANGGDTGGYTIEVSTVPSEYVRRSMVRELGVDGERRVRVQAGADRFAFRHLDGVASRRNVWIPCKRKLDGLIQR